MTDHFFNSFQLMDNRSSKKKSLLIRYTIIPALIIGCIGQTQNADDKLKTKLWDVKHTFNTEMQLEAFEWLDKYMK